MGMTRSGEYVPGVYLHDGALQVGDVVYVLDDGTAPAVSPFGLPVDAEDAPGDDGAAVVELLTGRLEVAEELTGQDIDALAYVIGDRRAAARLVRELNGESRQRRRRREPRTVWQWFSGAPHEAPEPLPDSLSRVVLRLQSGEALSRADLDRLARVIGRTVLGRLQSELARARRRGGWGW